MLLEYLFCLPFCLFTVSRIERKERISISHTALLGLCQVGKVGIILVSSLESERGIMTRLRVKEVAQAKGFTMAKLQRAADINLKTMQAIWHNPQHDASFKTLDKIAKALGVPVTALIEDVPDDGGTR